VRQRLYVIDRGVLALALVVAVAVGAVFGGALGAWLFGSPAARGEAIFPSGGGTTLPAGGTAGQALVRKGTTELEWKSLALGSESVISEYLAKESVTEAKLGPESVSSAKIKSAAITAAKLATEAVETAAVHAGAITEAKLAAEAVSEGVLKAEAVSAAKLASAAVTHAKIGSEAVEASNIKAHTIGETQITGESIGTGAILNSSVTTAKLASEAVTEAKLKRGTEAKLVPTGGTAGECLKRKSTAELEWATCGGAGLSSESVITEYLAKEAVTEAKLGPEAVSESKIAGGAVSEAKLKNEAVSEAKLKAKAVTGAKIAKETIKQENIELHSIGEQQLGVESVGTNSILGESITNGKIKESSLTETKFAAGILPAEESITVTTAEQALKVKKATLFFLTIEHEVTLKVQETPSRPSVLYIFYKENATGGFPVKVEGVKWPGGVEPKLPTGANKEGEIKLFLQNGKDTTPYGDAPPQLESVAAENLAAEIVETAKIKNGAVTEAKLASEAVTEAKLHSGAVTESKIASEAVTEAKLKQGSEGKLVPTGGSAGNVLKRKGTSELEWGAVMGEPGTPGTASELTAGVEREVPNEPTQVYVTVKMKAEKVKGELLVEGKGVFTWPEVTYATSSVFTFSFPLKAKGKWKLEIPTGGINSAESKYTYQPL
jgi:hypothetical protein